MKKDIFEISMRIFQVSTEESLNFSETSESLDPPKLIVRGVLMSAISRVVAQRKRQHARS
jgi:hypothetical protein